MNGLFNEKGIQNTAQPVPEIIKYITSESWPLVLSIPWSNKQKNMSIESKTWWACAAVFTWHGEKSMWFVARCEDEAQKELHMLRERNNQLDIGYGHWMGVMVEQG